MKRSMTVVGLLALVLVLGGTAHAQTEAFPQIIDLPNGFQPEGIVAGRGTTLYAGSLATGAIYQVNVRTGAGSIVVPGQEGRTAVGLAFDQRSNYVFAAGGRTGNAYVYNPATGETVAVLKLSTTDTTFVNDVVVTPDAAYFTDSFQPVLYRVPLDERTGRVATQDAVEVVPLGGDFDFVAGGFNSNGIHAAQNGRYLIVVNSTLGTLYRITARTGEVRQIDLGEDTVQQGDGILLLGRTLYVVQNRSNQIALVRLNGDFDRGTVTELITNPNFDVPTTIAVVGDFLYAVNARFGTPPTPDTEYTIVRVGQVR